MVMIMKLKSLQWINQPKMDDAKKLHQFYKQKHIQIPTIKELILDKLRFEMYVHDFDDGSWNDEKKIQELAITIGLNFDELPHHDDIDGWKKLGYVGNW